MGKTFLLVIDAYNTKWLNVYITSVLLLQLQSNYCESCFGLPEVVVSDNTTAFTNDEFEAFMQAKGMFISLHNTPLQMG